MYEGAPSPFGGALRGRSGSFHPAFLILVPLLGIFGQPVHGYGASLPGVHPPSPAEALAAVAVREDSAVSLETALLRAASDAAEDLTGAPFDPVAVEREIDRLAAGARLAIGDRKRPKEVIAALNRFLFRKEGFTYDCAAGNPDYYFLDRMIAGKRGNCLGLAALYLVLAERLLLPIYGVYVPSHCFARYEDGSVRVNIEMGEKGGARDDGSYRRDFGFGEEGPYLVSLGKNQMLGVYLKSLGAAFSRKGREERALGLYRAAAAVYPGLPDVHFNAGVSLQKMGMLDQAVDEYRRALELDPRLAAARDNLGVALAKKGSFTEALAEARKAVALTPRSALSRGNLAATLCASGLLDEGIREFRKVLEIDPGNRRALAGLASAYYARGDFREALRYFDRGVEAGCRFAPSLREGLEAKRSCLADTGS